MLEIKKYFSRILNVSDKIFRSMNLKKEEEEEKNSFAIFEKIKPSITTQILACSGTLQSNCLQSRFGSPRGLWFFPKLKSLLRGREVWNNRNGVKKDATKQLMARIPGRKFLKRTSTQLRETLEYFSGMRFF